jgi:hypothetical protein
MKKVYADIQLGYTKRDFDEPSQKLKMEFDCDKYQVTVKKKKKDYIDDF